MIFGEIDLGKWMHRMFRGYSAETVQSVIRNHTGTKTDEALNYVMGTVLIALFLISTIFNPYLIYINLKKKPSIPTRLFIMLEIMDFFTNIRVPIAVAVLAFSPDLKRLYEIEFDIPMYSTVFSFLYLVCGNSTGAVATAIAICRYLSISNPFLRIKGWIVALILSLYFILVSISYFWFTWGFRWPHQEVARLRACQLVFYLDHDDFGFISKIRLSVSSIGILPGVIASMLTAVSLVKTTGVQKSSDAKKKKGALMVILMNVGNLLFIVTGTLNLFYILRNQYIIFASSVMTPIILSAFNPAIFLITTSSARPGKRAASYYITRSQT